MWQSTFLGLMSWVGNIVAVYISMLDVMGRRQLWLSTILGLMTWVGDNVAVYIPRLDVMVRRHCGCLHF